MSSISGERWVTRAIGPPLATAALRAATLLSRPTWRGTIISGKITVSRRATRGSSRIAGSALAEAAFEAAAFDAAPLAAALAEVALAALVLDGLALAETLARVPSPASVGSVARVVRRLVSGFDGLLAIAWFS